MAMDHDYIETELIFEGAIAGTGYGKFNILLLALVGATYSSVAMEVTLVSFVLPSAKCDFEMSSSDGGLLTALPMLGMTIGSFFWGCAANVLGRRWVLASSLLMGGICGFISSFAEYFTIFLIFRFLNGFALAGSLSICLPYLGEFHHASVRERVLSWMELFWTIGVICLPCLAWLIIPLDVRYESPIFMYDSWNIFVAASAIPVIVLGAWTSTFPESPKFLMENGESEKALEVLQYMFSMNTGRDSSEYPLENLTEKGVSFIGMEKCQKEKEPITIMTCLKSLGSVTNALFQPPHRKSTILACFISYGLTASYYTLMMWFPELFTRFEHYESLHPGNSSSVCIVSSVVLEEVHMCESGRTRLDARVYMNTITVGLACIPTSLWYPLCIHKLGAKFFMICCLLVAACVTIAMYFVTNSLENLIMSCVFEAFTSLGVVTLFCALVDLFPTNVRVMASGLTICFGRLGALTGNLIFGFLIDLNCIVPILVFTLLLLGTAVMCFFLPIQRNKSDT